MSWNHKNPLCRTLLNTLIRKISFSLYLGSTILLVTTESYLIVFAIAKSQFIFINGMGRRAIISGLLSPIQWRTCGRVDVDVVLDLFDRFQMMDP